MLQAPTNDQKTKAEASSKTAEHLPQQSSQLLGGMSRWRQSQPLQQKENLAALQKAYGNQAVLRMKGRSAEKPLITSYSLSQSRILQRQCACGNTVGSSGTCTACEAEPKTFLLKNVPNKLAIGQPEDKYEKEADRVAKQVMRMSEPRTELEPIPIQQYPVNITSVPRKRLQMSYEGNKRSTDTPMEAPASVHNVLDMPGQPLDRSTKAFFETRFHRDLDDVRIHTDAAANFSAWEVDALAYTVGQHIAFASGQYAPHTETGRLLLAHELTHVLQQQGGETDFGIQASSFRVSRGIAGNCISSTMDNCTLGTEIHRVIQRMMIGLYPSTMFAEVGIPGGGTASCENTPGYIDLYASFPPGIVPIGGAGRMFPPPIASFPSPAPVPGPVMLGSIKPFTMPGALARADLASYITALDTFVAGLGHPYSIAEPMMVPIPLTWAVPGLPFPFSPATLPQMLHVFTTFDGMFWYFCRPLVELAWLAREAARLVSEMIDALKRAAQRMSQELVHAFESILAALAIALRAVGEFLEEWGTTILLVVALIAVAIIVALAWEVIVAIVAAAAAAAAAFFAEAATSLAALGALGAILLLLLPSQASAAETSPPSPAAPGDGQPSGGMGNQSVGQSTAGLRQLFEQLQAQSSGSVSEPPEMAIRRILRLIDDAERSIRLLPGGDLLVYVLELLRHLLEQQLRQQSLPLPPTPPGITPPSANGGTSSPSGSSAAGESTLPPATQTPPSGNLAAGESTSPSPTQTPPSAAPPTQQTPTPPTVGGGNTMQPSGGSGERTLGSGGSQSSSATGSGGGSSGSVVVGNVWPIIYEEIGTSRHFQILPHTSVSNGTLSILQGSNPAAILRVTTSANGSLELRNTTLGNRIVAVVAPSSLISGGYQLVSGPLKDALDEDFSQWRRVNRRPRLDDLVTPQLHFR